MLPGIRFDPFKNFEFPGILEIPAIRNSKGIPAIPQGPELELCPYHVPPLTFVTVTIVTVTLRHLREIY